jgi:hypothetical protein
MQCPISVTDYFISPDRHRDHFQIWIFFSHVAGQFRVLLKTNEVFCVARNPFTRHYQPLSVTVSYLDIDCLLRDAIHQHMNHTRQVSCQNKTSHMKRDILTTTNGISYQRHTTYLCHDQVTQRRHKTTTMYTDYYTSTENYILFIQCLRQANVIRSYKLSNDSFVSIKMTQFSRNDITHQRFQYTTLQPPWSFLIRNRIKIGEESTQKTIESITNNSCLKICTHFRNFRLNTHWCRHHLAENA